MSYTKQWVHFHHHLAVPATITVIIVIIVMKNIIQHQLEMKDLILTMHQVSTLYKIVYLFFFKKLKQLIFFNIQKTVSLQAYVKAHLFTFFFFRR